LLTVAISDQISDLEVVEEIYQAVFEGYDQLKTNTLVKFDRQVMVFAIPDVFLGKCTPYTGVVFISPENLDSVKFKELLIGASTGINEPWVRAGLAYLASGDKVDDQVLKNWYQETQDLNILGLFVARFMEDWATPEEVEIARMTAASLIQYGTENEGIAIEALGSSINNDIRNRWLASIGVERTVDYAYDGFYEKFDDISHTSDCSLILKSETINFCLNRLAETPFPFFDEVHEAEAFAYRVYTTRQTVDEYLLINAPSISDQLYSDEKITIEVRPLEVSLGLIEGNIIKVHNYGIPYYVSSMMIMTYDWYDDLFFNNNAGLLLQYGFSEYLGHLLPIYEQTRKRIVWEDIQGLESSPGISFWYFLDEEQLETAKAWYLKQDGSLEDEDDIDMRLFTDAIAYATIDRIAYGGPLGMSIGVRAQHFNPGLDLSEMDGLEMTYTQAASYVAWLCDTYSIDTVMDTYVNDDSSTALGSMDYETLKGAWLDDLKTRGEGIPIPDSP
jgi:hypothetical protein